MKRVNEARNTVVNRRLKGLAIITGMVLLFSSGISVAAPADFKLFQKPAKSEKFVELAHMSDDDKALAVKLLKTDSSPANTIEFVQKFSSEPFKFVEGVKEAYKALPDAAAKEAFTVSLKKSMQEVANEMFGSRLPGRKVALMVLIEELLKSKDIDKDDLLKELFSDDMIAELKLETKLPAEKPTEEPTKVAEDKKSILDTVGDKLTELKDEFFARIAKDKKDKEAAGPAADTKVDDSASKAKPVDVGALPGGATPGGAVPGAAPQAGVRAVGEVNNAAMEKLVNQICDFKAAQDAERASGEAKLLALNDGLNNQLNAAVLAQSKALGQNKKNDLEATAAGIINGLNNDQGKQNSVANAPSPVAPPPVASNARREDNNPLPVPTPDQPQQPQPQAAAPFQLPVSADNTPIRVATGKLAITDATNELDRAEGIAAALEQREPYTKRIAALGPNVASAVLVEPISKLDADINRANSALRVANDKAKSLDRALVNLKEGGRKALAEGDLKKEKQYQLEFQEKKEAFDQEKSMIQQQIQQVQQSGGDVASYSQQANAYLQQKQQELAQAKKRKEAFEGELELKVESLNGEIKALAGQRDDLKSVAADLEGKVATLKSEQSTLSGMYTSAVQREMNAITNPTGAAGNGTAAYGNNASKILGYSNTSRTNGGAQLPGRLQRGGVPTSTPANLTTGNAGRGMLSGKNAQ